MSDRHSGFGQHRRAPRPITATYSTNQGGGFLGKFHEHSPSSTQLMGFLTLIISGGILLLLTGLTVTTIVLGLIFLAPLLIISSPIWVPAAAILFVSVAGFLSMCGFVVAVTAALSWMYRYSRGLNPPGSNRVQYARSRIADTATHVIDYAREYGGYLHGKVKDAAPGA
ncbi:oleosin G-like [Cornus florida]|uniref:oleosin G-like n=1 Tax=Cornus florida TaxID=4283 RepID=UPI00289726AF|nr:oleosin G-like [Cornus florida]